MSEQSRFRKEPSALLLHRHRAHPLIAMPKERKSPTEEPEDQEFEENDDDLAYDPDQNPEERRQVRALYLPP